MADAPKVPPPAPPVPPPDLLPELQARVDLVTRRLDLLERRIASWENQLAEAEKKLATTEQQPVAQQAIDRFDDLEARIRRLERKAMQSRTRELTAGLGEPARSDGAARIPVSVDDPDARALVFARWSPIKATPGERVTLSVLIDGFDADEMVHFVISELGGETLPPLGVPAGTGDEVSVGWTPPKPKKGGHREFTFIVRCRDREAHAPILVVTDTES